jgi:hypothetical protein
LSNTKKQKVRILKIERLKSRGQRAKAIENGGKEQRRKAKGK